MRFRSLAAAAALTVLAGTAVAATAPSLAALGAQTYDPRLPAPAFTLPDLDGKAARLEDLKGKVVLLFFWATW